MLDNGAIKAIENAMQDGCTEDEGVRLHAELVAQENAHLGLVHAAHAGGGVLFRLVDKFAGDLRDG